MKEARHSRTSGPIRVFLSHAQDDSAVARKIRTILYRRLHSNVVTNEDLSAGQDWQSQLRRELEKADVFIALLTPNSIADSCILQETGAAWALDKPIIPLVTRQDILDRFPIQLRTYQALDLKDLDTPEGSERFAEALEHSLASSRLSTRFTIT